MSKVDLDKLEALEKAATPGPWLFDFLGDGLTDQNYKVLFDDYIRHDGELVHAMRNALPHMIAELKAAREVVRRARIPAKVGSITHESRSNVYTLLMQTLAVYDEVTGE